jgi:hypothetical protein
VNASKPLDSFVLPSIMRATVGLVAIGARRYIDWIQALHRWGASFSIRGAQQVTLEHRYIALFGWTLAVWISWNPLVDNRQKNGASTKSVQAIDLIGKLLFGIYLCSAVLLFEKFSIQWIAGKFHERSYSGMYMFSHL